MYCFFRLFCVQFFDFVYFIVCYICVLVPAWQLTSVLLNDVLNYYHSKYCHHYYHCQSTAENMYVTTKFSTSDITNREANISSISKGSPCILWNLKDQWIVPKNPTHISILSHTNTVHNLQFYFFNMCFNTIFPSTPMSSQCFPVSKFPNQKPVWISFLPYANGSMKFSKPCCRLHPATRTLLKPSRWSLLKAKGWSLQHGHYSNPGAEACNTNATQTQAHQISNTQRTEKKTTEVVIQQHSRKLLMMDILMSETCWAHNKWNKIASDIKLVIYSLPELTCLEVSDTVNFCL